MPKATQNLPQYPAEVEAKFPNINKPALQVRHADLTPWNDESAYKRLCPTCNTGVLLVSRDPNQGFALVALDRCTCCGQPVVYTDIDEMNGREGVLAGPGSE